MGIENVGTSDGELVRCVLAGDTGAYGALVARYRDRLGRYAVHMLGDRQDAEEALQEAFLLKHIEDLEYEEMAQLTGAGISALKMRVKRAREQLQVIFREAERV